MSVDLAGDLPVSTRRAARSRIARLLSARAKATAAVVLLTGGATLAALAGPLLIGRVVDAVSSGGPGASTTVRLAAGAALGLVLVAAGLRYLAEVRAARVGESALAELRGEVFEHALDLPVTAVERAGGGDLVARLSGDVGVVARVVRRTVPGVFFAVVELSVTVVVLLLLEPLLTLAALGVGAPVGVAGARWYFRRAPARYAAERRAQARLAAGLLEAYDGAATLAAYGAAEARREVLVARGAETVRSELATASARNRMRPTVNLAVGAALVTTVLIGAGLIDRNAMTIGALSAVSLYLLRLASPVSTLLEEADRIEQAAAAVARLVGVTEVPRRPRPSPHVGPQVPILTGGAVALHGVTFGYDPDRPVVHDVNLEVGLGERLTIVGPSGCGKTTLARLLTGDLRAEAGTVHVLGGPVQRYAPEALVGTIMLVDQEGHVFERTVADNVRLGRPDATDAEVRAALVAVGADRWVAGLPRGIHTMVGERHHGLTPAQAQELGLARVVCADPVVVVLDEATSGLDPGSAARTERLMERVLGGRTVVTIAHRLDAARRADRVAVMEDGHLVDVGPHTRLLERCPAYAALWAVHDAALE